MTWAICEDCKREMVQEGGCTFRYFIDKEGKYWERVTCEDDICHDCNAGLGKVHHSGCDNEECPKCGGQAISCDCEFTHLAINKK